MALLVAESFDELPASTSFHSLLNKLYAWSGASISSFNNAGGRVNGRYHGYALQSAVNLFQLTWNLPANLSEVYLALAVERLSDATGIVLAFRDSTSTQVDLRMAGTNGKDLQVTRNGTQIGYANDVFPLNVWVWLSIRLVVHATTGVVEVRDGAGNTILNLTNVNTKNTANAYVNNIFLGNGNPLRAFDDVFIMDTSGANFNGHLTERAIRTLFPNADGSVLQWTANGAANRWDCVDEQTPDEDTTYISSDTPGQINLSALSDMAGNESGIEAVIVQHRSRKDDTGARSVRSLVRTGGANYTGTTSSLASSYAHYASIWLTNPNTGSAWTRTEIDALEVGVETVT
jgi:hypothetical protein